MQKPLKALVIGATGLCGNQCLIQLLNDEAYGSVEIWVRRSCGIVHPKLTEKIVDFGRISETECITAQHVFCCLGTTIKKAGSRENFTRIDHDYVISVARIAERSQVEKFLYISSMGANKNSQNFYLRTKGKVEESLGMLVFPSLVIFRPSMLMGHREEHRFGEQVGKAVMKALGFMFIGKLSKYRGVEASLVAKAMLHEAKKEKSGISIIESDKIQLYRTLE